MTQAAGSSAALLVEAGAVATRAERIALDRPGGAWRDWSTWALGVSLLLGLLLRWQYWALAKVIGTDGVWYAVLGVDLLHGRGYTDPTGAVNVFYPPLYPVGIGLASFLIHDPESAGRLVSLIAGLALVGVAYALARLAFDRRVAAGAALLTALLPTLANSSVLVLNDTLYVCCLYAALLAGLLAERAAGRRRLAWHALTGALFAATALARPEGYVYFPAWLALLLVLRWAGRRDGARWRPGAALVVATVAYVIVLAPYLVFLRVETGAWRLTTKTATNVVLAYRGAAADERNQASLNAAGTAMGGFAANRDSLPAEARRAPLHFLKHYRSELLTESNMLFDQLTPVLVLLVPLGLFALPWLRERRLARAALLLPLLQLAFLPLFALEPRYLLAVLPAALIFAAAGALPLAERASHTVALRYRALSRTGAISAILALWLVWAGPLLILEVTGHTNEAQQPVESRLAGKWFKAHYPAGQVMMAQKPYVPFYSESRLVQLPMADEARTLAYARAQGAHFLTIEERSLTACPRCRPALYPLLNGPPPPGLTLVYDSQSPPGARVRIFAITP